MYVPATDYDREQVDRSMDEVKAGFPNDVERIVYSRTVVLCIQVGSEQERLGEPEWDIRGVFWSSPFFLSTEPATQATLRRTVSTAYYALFHLLVEDACQLWAQATHRGKLSRQFEHRRMNLETAVTRVVCS